jgi:uracil-DNA glycosylase
VRLLDRVRVVVGLGKIGFDAAVDACAAAGLAEFPCRPPFAHGAVWNSGGLTFIASFHPSRQNTFTGRLTRPMFRQIFRKARRTLERVV